MGPPRKIKTTSHMWAQPFLTPCCPEEMMVLVEMYLDRLTGAWCFWCGISFVCFRALQQIFADLIVFLFYFVGVCLVTKKKMRIFSVCTTPPPPPPQYVMRPPVTEHVSLHSKSLCKNIARASGGGGGGGANNMRPLSWGAQTEKIRKCFALQRHQLRDHDAKNPLNHLAILWYPFLLILLSAFQDCHGYVVAVL